MILGCWSGEFGGGDGEFWRRKGGNGGGFW